ncbi:symporter [Aureococcus anophagefferens]|nr:symporter [Aureococcus anophagefferens]
MALRVPVSGWRGTACVVECGHDSSCAQAYVEGGRGPGAGGRRLPGPRAPAGQEGALLRAVARRGRAGDDRGRVRCRRRDAAVSEECYLATELLFARQDECPLPALAAAPPLHICAADAIKLRRRQAAAPAAPAGVIVTGCDDACHEGCDVRVAQELGNLLRGTVRVASRARLGRGAAFAARRRQATAHAKWVVSRSDYDAMVAARGVYAKDGRATTAAATTSSP